MAPGRRGKGRHFPVPPRGERTMIWRWLLIGWLLLGWTACAPVISPEVRAQLAPRLSFFQIAADPDASVGKTVMLAGTIIEAKNVPAGTRLEVLQYPATHRGRPLLTANPGGRFLVIAPEYLETAVYRPGRAITVAGTIQGARELPLGEITYRYPTLTPLELHLWPEGSVSPRLHLGFGFGFSQGL
jgi:outer membrane lipoprotein